MIVEDFKKFVASSCIHNSLYHFTDRKNLASIAEFEILSKQETVRRGIVVKAPGGNDLSRDVDTLKRLDNYVNLCFTKHHPMCYRAQKKGRIPNPRYLRIDLDILKFDGVKVTPNVANEAGTNLLDVEHGLEELDKEVLYTPTNWSKPRIRDRL